MIHTVTAFDKVKMSLQVNPSTTRPTFKAFWTLYILGWRKANWGLQLGVGGWRLRVACMWLCVSYSPPLFLH